MKINIKKFTKPAYKVSTKIATATMKYSTAKAKYKSPGIPNIAGYRGYSAGKIEAANRRLKILQAGRAKLAAMRQMQAIQRHNELYRQRQMPQPQYPRQYSPAEPEVPINSAQAQQYDPYDSRNYTPEETQGGFYVPTERLPKVEDRTMMGRCPISTESTFFIPQNPGENKSTMLGKRGRGI